jgi:hypothetical protein
MQADLNFTWFRERDPRDYKDIMPELRREKLPRISDYILKDQISRIVAKGVAVESYQPLDKFPDLYARFADIRSQDDAAKFIRTFGPLTEEGLPKGKGDDLFDVLRQAQCMAAGNLLVFTQLNPVFTQLNASLVAERDGLHLKIAPTNLLEALWLQFAQAVSKGLANRCKQCEALFATGPDAKRRRGAEFCSIECKTKYHSLKRSRP